MADFRKWLYALALVALLAGLTSTASAQTGNAINCSSAQASVPPIVRFEGYTELVGDLVLTCTGGTPTPAGQTVPPVNITILLSTNITSRLLSGGTNPFNEALLLVDEPNGAAITRPILNCGAVGAPDTGVSGPGVCAITATGNPAQTYDGTAGVSNLTPCNGGSNPSSSAYGCGRPNVFQGRQGSLQSANQFNSTVFAGVPLDPPGTQTVRTLRITNVRANAQGAGLSSTFTTSNITMNISFNGTTTVLLNNPQQLVAYVQKGLIPAVQSNTAFLQCTSLNAAIYNNSTGTATANIPGTFTYRPDSPISNATLGIRFSEGFNSSFKVRNISEIIALGDNTTPGNGIFQANAAYWQWAGSPSGTTPINNPNDVNQNVPGVSYNTETAFEFNSSFGVPSPNPPKGVGTVASGVTPPGGAAFSSGNYTGVSGTGIANAGRADQGTRLVASFAGVVAGTQVFVPSIAYLYRSNSHNSFASGNPTGINTGVRTGVAQLVSTDAAGAGSFQRLPSGSGIIGSTGSGATTDQNFVAVGSGNIAVYEVLWADPFSQEDLDVPVILSYPSNLTQNLPTSGVPATVALGFAPFYSTAAAAAPSGTLPIPRFVPGSAPVTLYQIVQCACNLLFPYVASVAGFDTGIAIANTSVDPGPTFGFGTTSSPTVSQQGPVQFWYYGLGANGTTPPATQCTNTASPGACPGTTPVPGGQVMTYVASSGSTTWGLDGRAAGFVGYVIAQAKFQYCHAFAYVSAIGAGPLTPGTSEGYLGLLLDNTGLANGLSRTTQLGENLVH